MKLRHKLVALSCVALFLTGCGSKINLDLGKVEEKVDALTSDKISMGGMTSNILEANVYPENMVDLFSLEEIGIDQELVGGQFLISWEALDNAKDENSVLSYVVLEPVEGKMEEVKKQLDTFYEQLLATYQAKEDETSKKNVTLLKNRMVKEQDGFLISIVSEDNQKVMNAILKSKAPIFGMLQKIDKDGLETLGLKEEDLDEYLIKTPMMIVSASGYYVVKPAKGKEAEVKKAMDEYMKKQEEQWATYLPDQHELAKNRKETKVGDYLVYIVSQDNDKVLKEMKNQTK